LLEKDSSTEVKKLLASDPVMNRIGKNYKLLGISKTYKQQLTHQTIHGYFIHIQLTKKMVENGYESIEKSKMRKLAFPRLITTYFEDEKALLL